MAQTHCTKTKYIALIFLFVLLFSFSEAYAEPDQKNTTVKPLVFGFLPIISSKKLVARFGPLADYLAEKLGRPVRIETAPDYVQFLNRTNNEKRYDILFTAPHFYYLAHRDANYQVLVRVNAPELRAIIVAPGNSNLRTLNDLRGHSLSTADPMALGTALVRARLITAGIDPDKDLTLVATPSHNASLLSAHKGVTDAASLMIPPFERARPEIKNAMRIIDKTTGTPHMPISVAPWLPAKEISVIETSLITMSSTQEGQALLKHLSWPGFVKATPKEYESLKLVAEQLKLP
ncbi:MAG: phosphate/phosphite/phosphonate ABC transporter substrate-binding protein [Gammaproteobacteria bacterium]|nr:phosphate/phosphite/phosphonate ABC transporter substrate-binding protein [Gammaproteobacteria bacterium]